MSTTDSSLSRLYYWVLGYAVFWVVIILLFAGQISLVLGQPIEIGLVGSATLWAPWMLVSPLMLLMGYWLPPGRLKWWKFSLLHLAACSLLILLAVLITPVLPPPPGQGPNERQRGPTNPSMDDQGFPPFLRPPPSDFEQPAPRDPNDPPPRNRLPRPRPEFLPAVERTLPVGLPLYVAAILLVGSIRLSNFSQQKVRQAIDLEAKLSAAKLTALQLQLQPHFLFNTLNTLASLVHTDAEKAEEVLLSLCTLLRATLDTQNRPLIPLRQELDLVRCYLDVQRARYGERLRTEEMIPVDTLSCAVPPLVMLPVVENAVKHALEPNPEGATICLRTERIGDKLIVQLEDSGAGRTSVPTAGHGVGVANTRARLKVSFPNQPIAFDLIPNHLGGITARFEMPARSATSTNTEALTE